MFFRAKLFFTMCHTWVKTLKASSHAENGNSRDTKFLADSEIFILINSFISLMSEAIAPLSIQT